MDRSIWERYRAGWRALEARRRAEAEARRSAARTAAEVVIQSVAPRYPGIRRVYLFGPILRPGAFRPDSDIDVAVEGDDGRGLLDFWRDLEAAAPGWIFDVRPLEPGNSFSERIRSRGLVVYERASENS